MRQLTLGPEFVYLVPTNICNNCGEEWDAGADADKNRELALAQARKDLAAYLIDDLIEKEGLKLSYIERAFELPQRTISSKWRGGISSSGLALLRIIKAMPWIVNIADNKFSPSAISYEVGNLLIANGTTFETTVGDRNGIHVKITKTANETKNQHAKIDMNTMMLSTGT